MSRFSVLFFALLVPVVPAIQAAGGSDPALAGKLERLVAAYPDHLEKIDGNDLVWRDGTRMPIEDGSGEKAFDDWLEAPDIGDMLKLSYPAGAPLTVPPAEFDPGRARNDAFFRKLYGLEKVGTLEQDCRRAEANRAKLLTPIVWLPNKAKARIWVSKFNGIPERFKAVSAELDALPAAFDRFLASTAGVFACRRIEGTERLSPHSFGMTIDIGKPYWSYWRWDLAFKPRTPVREGSLPVPPYRNQIPAEIVHIFERHGFIWGGRWSHYDTMHFEYRPELFDSPPGR